MKLSSYTIAKNCTDKTDLNNGIEEIKEYFKKCSKEGKKPVQTAYLRLAKLIEKKTLLTQ
jgi:hypothetical protein